MGLHRRQVLLSMAGALAARPLAAFAAGYPDHPIKLVVPFAAGGITDVLGRVWANGAAPELGTIVIENRGGGGSMIGATEVAHAAPDGYTLLVGNTSNQVLNPELMASPPFNAEKDLIALAIFTAIPNVIVASASLPARDLKELAAYARKNPGKLSYGSAGVGTMTNLSGELFKKLGGDLNIVHVPYRGGAPVIADLISGTLPIASLSVAAPLLALHKQGKIRILCVEAEKRLTIAPDIPTAAESGFPDLVVEVFDGIFAPTGTPQPAIDKVVAANAIAMKNPIVLGTIEKVGGHPMSFTDPESAAKFMAIERNRWRPIIREIGIPKR